MTTLRNEERFDVIAYEDLSPEDSWTKLGKGSFGAVWKGEYLGLEVAIKEVLASDEYDVDKYFQRECLLMSSSRHPNIVQFLGLCRAPAIAPSIRKRTLIISEYLPRGNLRAYIDDVRLPFPWRLRVSFAVDIVRALAYLHVRKCMHRDLKGENMLVSENERIKLTDFGFARIAPRNEAEIARMSYCGTDGYMSPEILLGEKFDLASDIYSLGIVLIELCCRKLASSSFLVRYPPWFTLDRDQVIPYLTPGCPPDLIELALRCASVEPEMRPNIKEILARLSIIEKDVLRSELTTVRQFAGTINVGTLSFAGTTRKSKVRPSAPRLPSFEGRVKVPSLRESTLVRDVPVSVEDEDDIEALAIADVRIDAGHLAPPEPQTHKDAEYSTVVLKHGSSVSEADLPSLPSSWLADADESKSYLTAKGSKGSTVSVDTTQAVVNTRAVQDHSTIRTLPSDTAAKAFETMLQNVTLDDLALENVHRFSLVKPGLQRFLGLYSPPHQPDSRRSSVETKRPALTNATNGKTNPATTVNGVVVAKRRSEDGLLAALGAGTKCKVCDKRLPVLKAWLACDDCPTKCHIKCSDLAMPNCPSKE